MHIFVVGSDGRRSSAGAILVADCLARRDGGTAQLVTVGDDATGRMGYALLDDLVTSPTDWTHTVVAGNVVDVLARTGGPSLLVVGLPVASPRRTVLALAAAAGAPILCVPPEVSELPRCAVLALDFGRTSLRAAAIALRLLERPGRACTVSAEKVMIAGSSEAHLDVLLDAFEDLFGQPRDITMGRRRIASDPVSAILDTSAAEEADLIALGRCGWSRSSYTQSDHLGHVAQEVLRLASCSVLLAPPS